jgi:hypothetical protein
MFERLDPPITVNILYRDWPMVQTYFIQNYFAHGVDYFVVRFTDQLVIIRFMSRILYVDFSNRFEKVVVHVDPGGSTI